MCMHIYLLVVNTSVHICTHAKRLLIKFKGHIISHMTITQAPNI